MSLLLTINLINSYFRIEFDYTSSCKLSQKEVIFYFIRLYPKGIFYTMYEDFVKELHGVAYELLPLERPTSDNLRKRRELENKEKSVVSELANLAENMLQGYTGTNEVMSRQNVTRYGSTFLT